MSLRIRRGIDSQRRTVVLDTGEIAWSTDEKKLYVGDGFTSGGINILATSAGDGLEWNAVTQKLDYSGALGNALQTVSEDTAPQLGGNLDLNNKVINGVGSINITGGVTATLLTLTDGVNGDLELNNHDIIDVINIVAAGSVSADTLSLINGLGRNLPLNSYNINGTGNIDITGNLSASGTLTATTGLGANLPLNSYNINGTGNINITGDVTASGTVTAPQVSANTNGTGTNYKVGDDVYIGDINIDNTMVVKGQQDATKGYIIFGNADTTSKLGRNGSGPLTYAGDFSVSGTLTATTGLGANLSLNGKNITGTGNVNIFGTVTAGTVNTGIINVTNNLSNGGIRIETNNSNLDEGFDLLTLSTYYTSSVFPASMIMSRGRGTKSSPSAVQDGDALGAFTFTGYTDTDTTKPAAIILASAIAPITTGNNGIVPGQFQFLTTNSAGNFDTALTINSSAGVVASKSITPGVYTNIAARDAAITVPSPGMLVYVTDQSKFYGYVDDAGLGSPGWVALN